MKENPFTEIEKQLAALQMQLSKQHNQSPDWMTFDEVCDYLNLSKSKIYKLTMTNGIPLYKLGRILKFRRDEIDAWIIEHKVKKLESQGVEIEQ